MSEQKGKPEWALIIAVIALGLEIVRTVTGATSSIESRILRVECKLQIGDCKP